LASSRYSPECEGAAEPVAVLGAGIPDETSLTARSIRGAGTAHNQIPDPRTRPEEGTETPSKIPGRAPGAQTISGIMSPGHVRTRTPRAHRKRRVDGARPGQDRRPGRGYPPP